MNHLKLYWVSLISKAIWTDEMLFFYPKLARTYRGMTGIESVDGVGVTILDIGANKGQSIKFFSKIFDKPTIYAFEPSPRTFGSLKKFVEKLNGLQISIYQIGIGEKEQTINFY